MANADKKSFQTEFDFDQYNKVTSRAPVGLKLFLAQQMIGDAEAQAFKYRKQPGGQEIFESLEAINELISDVRAMRTAAADKNSKSSPGTPDAEKDDSDK